MRDGAAEATATQTTAPHSQFYHPFSFQQRGPVLIGEDAHVAPPSVGPRDRPEQQDQGCQGNHETPRVRHVSRSPSLSAFPLHLPAAVPLPLWAAAPLMRTTSQPGARAPPTPRQQLSAHVLALILLRKKERESGKCACLSRSARLKRMIADYGPLKSDRRGGRRRDQGDALEMSGPVVSTSA